MKVACQDRALFIVDDLRYSAALRRCTGCTQDRRDDGRGPRIETLQEHTFLFGKKWTRLNLATLGHPELSYRCDGSVVPDVSSADVKLFA